MTVSMEWAPDVEAGLLAQAQAEGLGLADYVRNLVRKEVAANRHAELQPDQPVKKKQSLSELFGTLRGVDIDFSRNPSTGRPVKL